MATRRARSPAWRSSHAPLEESRAPAGPDRIKASYPPAVYHTHATLEGLALDDSGDESVEEHSPRGLAGGGVPSESVLSPDGAGMPGYGSSSYECLGHQNSYSCSSPPSGRPRRECGAESPTRPAGVGPSASPERSIRSPVALLRRLSKGLARLPLRPPLGKPGEAALHLAREDDLENQLDALQENLLSAQAEGAAAHARAESLAAHLLAAEELLRVLREEKGAEAARGAQAAAACARLAAENEGLHAELAESESRAAASTAAAEEAVEACGILREQVAALKTERRSLRALAAQAMREAHAARDDEGARLAEGLGGRLGSGQDEGLGGRLGSGQGEGLGGRLGSGQGEGLGGKPAWGAGEEEPWRDRARRGMAALPAEEPAGTPWSHPLRPVRAEGEGARGGLPRAAEHERSRSPGRAEARSHRARVEEVAGAGAKPSSIEDIMRETQEMEDRLMTLGVEKNQLESEMARMPTNTAGKTIRERQRRRQVEDRLDDITKECSFLRLRIKRRGTFAG